MLLLMAFDAALVIHTKKVVSFRPLTVKVLPLFCFPLGLHCFSLWPLTDPAFIWPLLAGTRRSFFGEVSALADMSAKPLLCRRPTLNRPAIGLWPAAVGRLQGLFGHLGALTSCF